MDESTFISATTKATEFEIKAAGCFGALRELSEIVRERRKIMQNAQTRMAQLKAAPGLRGTIAQREHASHDIAVVERELREQQAIVAVIDAAIEEQREVANAAARQRDSTKEALAQMRREYSATLPARPAIPRETYSRAGG